MIRFIKADYPLYLEFKPALERLYIEAFTKGISAQHITNDEADSYLNQLFKKGYGIIGFSDDQLIAALIAIPLHLDTECPENIQQKYNKAESEYIAEVLVDDHFRGMGLGKKLMQTFENHLNKQTKNVLLRVWDKNEAAIALYKKSGFEVCGHITQEKRRPNSNEKFVMHKNYMVKTY